MEEDKKTVEFGRVVYVEPNNNINGTGRGTNFTFDPEDYSIFVDLQVSVVDRFATTVGGKGESIEYNVHWDTKSTRASVFRGTNGFLTTVALNNSHEDILEEYNNESIGINSIDIKYNSWNYPEVVIKFTDVRGASLLSPADYVHDKVNDAGKREEMGEGYANSFFSTFFRFPYPRFTLTVKGFYGRPVSYQLCVNDLRTSFNSSTGNFDITVSFIGYMYGIFTDIPFMLTMAAPYSEYVGREYWENAVKGGKFVYRNNDNGVESVVPMYTFFELNEAIKLITSNLNELPNVKRMMDEMKENKDKISSLNDLKAKYEDFKKLFSSDDSDNECFYEEYPSTNTDEKKYFVVFKKTSSKPECPNKDNHIPKEEKGKTVYYAKYRTAASVQQTIAGGTSRYVDIEEKCHTCKGDGYVEQNEVPVEDNTEIKKEFFNIIGNYNYHRENSYTKIPYIPGMGSEEECDRNYKGTILYERGTNEAPFSVVNKNIKSSVSGLKYVKDGDFDAFAEWLTGRVDSFNNNNKLASWNAIAVCAIEVGEFMAAITKNDAIAETENKSDTEKIESIQSEAYENLLGFKLTIKAVVDMCLAHLDTFMECVYKCMEEIEGANRTFEKAGIKDYETDVVTNGVDFVYLPPFFAYRKEVTEMVNGKPQTKLQNAWIEDRLDGKFSNKETFREIELIDGFLNGVLKTADVKDDVTAEIEKRILENYGVFGTDTKFYPTFISDLGNGESPYKNITDVEHLVAMFGLRSVLSSIYGADYPTFRSRPDSTTSAQYTNAGNYNDYARIDEEKLKYFESIGEVEAMNFTASTGFEAFKTSDMADAFKKIETSGFTEYILTGKKTRLCTGEKPVYKFDSSESGIFSTNENFYLVSLGEGQGENGEYFVPTIFSNPEEAGRAVADAFASGDTVFRNGFGISRTKAFPEVEIFTGREESNEIDNLELIKNTYGKFIYSPGDCVKVGLYQRVAEIWKDYFYSRRAEEDGWFPPIVMNSDIEVGVLQDDGKDTDVNRGNLYVPKSVDGSGDICAKSPALEQTSLKDFFLAREGGWVRRLINGELWNNAQTKVEGKTASKNYLEDTVIPNIIAAGTEYPEVTVIGLACGEGTLFESEFYKMQEENASDITGSVDDILGKTGTTEEDVIALRKAFLLLHSLPTSSYKKLGNAVASFMKVTYTPSITDIPLSSALFIGALYFRDEFVKNGEDKFMYYGDKFKKATSRQLITDYIEGKPLSPVKTTENGTYVTVIKETVENQLSEIEKKGKNPYVSAMQGGVTGWTDGEINYWGFWKLAGDVKYKFIKLFADWALNNFREDIGDKLELKRRGGEKINLNVIRQLKPVLISYKNGGVFGEAKRGESWVAKKDYTITGTTSYTIRKGETYNDFIKNFFDESLYQYHQRIGVSKTDDSLFTFLRAKSDPVIEIMKLLVRGCAIRVPFPRALMTRDVFSSGFTNERLNIRTKKTYIEKSWETFKNKIVEAIDGKAEDESQEAQGTSNPTPPSITPDQKLALYETIKNLHDKWLIAINREAYRFSNANKTPLSGTVANNFFYVNSFYEEKDDTPVNAQRLSELIDSFKASYERSLSIYSFMSEVSKETKLQLLALPIFNRLNDRNYVRQMFTPIPYDDIDFSSSGVESSYVFFYPEEPSKGLNLPTDGSDGYRFKDDSFILVTEDGSENKDTTVPSTFSDEGRMVPVIGVTFAKQNQSFFKNISVSMDSPKTTEVVIENTIQIADGYKKGSTSTVSIGQDLFSIYSNHSYECTVEMMGCACIMPLMYFQLNNIPMFKGTYIIYNVGHTISNGNMTTTFSGQRLSRYSTKRVEKSFIVTAGEDQMNSGLNGGLDGSEGGICYACSGAFLRNEQAYNDLAKKTKIDDKCILRAVEYAETHNSGGVFEKDGMVYMLYDPWMAYKNMNVSNQDLRVTGQCDTDYTSPDTFEGNYKNLKKASTSNLPTITGLQPVVNMKDVLIGDKYFPIDYLEKCTVIGAFGMPTQCWETCGAKSVEDFYENSEVGFSQQAVYFGNFLTAKRNEKLYKALKGKDWKTFAKLYRGVNGITDNGTWTPGDNEDFNNYVKDLETGYNDAVKATEIQNEISYVSSRGTIIGEPTAEAKNYANNRPPLDVFAAVTKLNSNSTKVLYVGDCNKINKTGMRKKDGKDVYYENSKGELLINTQEHKNNPGTKPANWPLGLCATYVKCALQAGGWESAGCNGGFCGEVLEDRGFYEIYRSGPGKEKTGKVVDSKWQTGDVMTIDSFGKHDYGHIAMWNGTNWVSDFRQNSCLCYPNDPAMPAAWDSGKYHFWRYANTKNV